MSIYKTFINNLTKSTTDKTGKINHEKEVHRAAQEGRWDDMINHAKRVPRNFDIHQQIPSMVEGGLPEEAVNKLLNSGVKDPSFLFELASNLHPDLSHKTLKRINESAPDDHYVQNHTEQHPNWKPESDPQHLGGLMASEFWRSYEKKVEPHHFASVKSMYSGKPEEVEDHRGAKGYSHIGAIKDGRFDHDENTIIPSSKEFNIQHAIPHLPEYAKKVQQAILADKWIPKRDFAGRPHVKLYRGVGGEYADKILESLKHDPESNEIDDKNINIDAAPFTSWTTEPDVAKVFALRREEGLGGKTPVVMSKWHPVDSILHSGNHHVVGGQDHAHRHEEEIVVGHPDEKLKIKSKDLIHPNENNQFKLRIKKAEKPNIEEHVHIHGKKPLGLTKRDKRMLKRGPEKELKGHKVVHFSNDPDLKEITPDPTTGGAYALASGSKNPFKGVHNNFSHKHIGKVSGKFYDIGKDPLKLMRSLEEYTKHLTPKILNDALKAHGFDGVIYSNKNHKVISSFKPVKVNETHKTTSKDNGHVSHNDHDTESKLLDVFKQKYPEHSARFLINLLKQLNK